MKTETPSLAATGAQSSKCDPSCLACLRERLKKLRDVVGANLPSAAAEELSAIIAGVDTAVEEKRDAEMARETDFQNVLINIVTKFPGITADGIFELTGKLTPHAHTTSPRAAVTSALADLEEFCILAQLGDGWYLLMTAAKKRELEAKRADLAHKHQIAFRARLKKRLSTPMVGIDPEATSVLHLTNETFESVAEVTGAVEQFFARFPDTGRTFLVVQFAPGKQYGAVPLEELRA